VLAEARVPGTEAGVMTLARRGDELAIRVDGLDLMSSRVHGSEDALADLALDRLGARGPIRVLVGGLGMGFTLAAALRRCGPHDEIVVAELVPELVGWHDGPLGDVAGRPLADPRVRVRVADVGDVLGEARGAWDAVMLDVDNGPEGLTRWSNDSLYDWRGLEVTRRALRPGGVVSYWSAAPNARFKRLLRDTGFDVDEVVVRARGKAGGRRHTVWIGRPRPRVGPG
jgi:spermidine synthase